MLVSHSTCLSIGCVSVIYWGRTSYTIVLPLTTEVTTNVYKYMYCTSTYCAQHPCSHHHDKRCGFYLTRFLPASYEKHNSSNNKGTGHWTRDGDDESLGCSERFRLRWLSKCPYAGVICCENKVARMLDRYDWSERVRFAKKKSDNVKFIY